MMEPRFLSLGKVKKYEPLARAWGVSAVARSPRGFLTQYKKAGGKASGLTPYWRNRRENFIKRHMAQLTGNREALWKFDKASERYLPTRRHLALIMWAYSPAASKL